MDTDTQQQLSGTLKPYKNYKPSQSSITPIKGSNGEKRKQPSSPNHSSELKQNNGTLQIVKKQKIIPNNTISPERCSKQITEQQQTNTASTIPDNLNTSSLSSAMLNDTSTQEAVRTADDITNTSDLDE